MSVSPNVDLCLGDSTRLTATGATTYTWLPTAGLSTPNAASTWATPRTTTEYYVIGSVGHCIPDTDTVVVFIRPIPVIDITAPILRFYPGDAITLTMTTDLPLSAINWDNTNTLNCAHCPNPVATPIATTTYTAVGVTMFGCTSQDSITLFMRSSCDEDAIVVPNGFTPNGDGLNDVLYVRGVSHITEFRVFDRWGNQVFFTSDVNTGWDGRFENEYSNAGVYVYMVTMQCPLTGEQVTKKGNVTLIR
jgi:gliding motility-associated-like protein